MKKKYLKSKEGSSIKGQVTIRSYKAGTIAKVMPLYERLKSEPMNAELKAEIEKIFARNELSQITKANLIMQGTSTGLGLILQRLLGTNTYTLNINYGAIGTGSTAPAITDTQLTAEVARTTIAFSQRVSNTQAEFQFFFPDTTLANQTYREFGMFVDGTSSANSGKIFNHALFTNAYAKATGTDTTVEVDLTLA